MKRSDKMALGMGGLTVGLGMAAAILCPVGGLIAGAYFTYGAVAATMGTGATVALTAAGGIGGLALGRIAAPIVGWGSVVVGAMIGGAAKLLTHKFDMGDNGAGNTRRFHQENKAVTGRKLDTSFDLSAQFKQERTTRNDNKSTKPQVKPSRGFHL